MTLSPFSGALIAAAGLTDVDRTLFVSTLVLFGIFTLVLTKFGWKPLLLVIEEREKAVRDGVESARKASDEAHALLEKHKEMLREAGREREEILRRALKEAESLKADLQTQARAESEQVIRRAREQVEREKAKAIQELRTHVADIAVGAAAKIVRSSLTPEAQRKLVDEFIASLPNAR